VNEWINNSGCKKNLLSNVNVCGVAVHKADDGVWFFTAMFSYLY